MDRHIDAYRALPTAVRDSIQEDGVLILDRWSIVLRREGVPDAKVAKYAMTAALAAIEMQMILRARPRD